MKVLIVDDHAVVREGLTALIRQAEPGATIIEATDAADGLALAEAHADLDIVVLDLALPGLGGDAAIREFGRRRPDVPIIVLSASEEPADAQQALAAGALGYVPKSAKAGTFMLALRLVLSGEIYLPPFLLDGLSAQPERAPPKASGAGVARLTERQTEVLRLIVRGMSNKAIAAALGLSEKTVKAHVTAIFRALNVENRTQAAGVARATGLI